MSRPGPARGWAIFSGLVGILILLGGFLPLAAHTRVMGKLVDGPSGAIFIGALTGLFVLVTVDIARGRVVALAAAGGLGTMVICMAGILSTFFWQFGRSRTIHLSPGAGSVCLFAAGGGALILTLGGLSRLSATATYRVHPLLAALAGGGGSAAVVSLCIPTVRGVSLRDYLLSGPGYLIFWMLAPLGLTLLCSLVALLTRSAGGMMLMLGSAAGLLVLWGADELVQTNSFPPVVYGHHGTWVAILIALSVSILAAVAALLVPWDRADDARPRGVALTPVIVLIAAIVFVTLLVTHHNSAEGIRLAAPSYLRQLAWPFSQPAMPAT